MTPFLDPWVCRRAGFAYTGGSGDRFRLERFQTAALRRTLVHAARHSRFYGKLLAGISPDAVSSLANLSGLPFTFPADLVAAQGRFSCISQDQVSRIFTLASSGTTGRPKRLMSSREDLEMTVDFFAASLKALMAPGDRGLIFLPGATPASAGDLIRQAMDRIGAVPRVHGLVMDAASAVREIREVRPRVIIGLPVQVLALAEMMAGTAGENIPWIILTADYVSPPVAARIQRRLKGRVLSHYGLTETGFGGALQCPAGEGLHLRHPHLVTEIVDPGSGRVLPPGQWGEITVTTLDRRAMPLIRYRTGDLSRILDRPCACGSPFFRLDRIRNRQAEGIRFGPGLNLTMADLDDVLFALEEVMDFSAEICDDSGTAVLSLGVETLTPVALERVEERLKRAGRVKKAIDSGLLCLGNIQTGHRAAGAHYVGKRLIRDLRIARPVIEETHEILRKRQG